MQIILLGIKLIQILISLIIELTLKEKIGDIAYIIYYLIDKYKSEKKTYLNGFYNDNLSNSE
jgi:hypothetical protein